MKLLTVTGGPTWPGNVALPAVDQVIGTVTFTPVGRVASGTGSTIGEYTANLVVGNGGVIRLLAIGGGPFKIWGGLRLGVTPSDTENIRAPVYLVREELVLAGREFSQEFHVEPYEHPTVDATWDYNAVPLHPIYVGGLPLSLQQARDLLGEVGQATDRANEAADRAELNTFIWYGDWAAGLFARRGGLVRHRQTIFRAVAENSGAEPNPDADTTSWEIFIPRGQQGPAGFPGSVNGVSTADLLLYPASPTLLSNTAPPSSWPRGVYVQDVLGGSLGYPFTAAKLFSIRDHTNGSTSQLALVWANANGLSEFWTRGASDTTDQFSNWTRGGDGSSEVITALQASVTSLNAQVTANSSGIGTANSNIAAVNADLQAFKALPPATAQLVENSRSSAQPVTDFPTGLSFMPTGGSGWPFPGVVETLRPSTTATATAPRQTIRQNGGSGIQQRTALAASPWWSAWSVYAEKGVRGTKRFQDVGVPTATNTSGVLDGDEYLNVTNGDLYIRTSGAWPAGPALNLRGLTGVSSYTRERRTGGTAGCLCVLVNGVWQVASPANSRLELATYGVLGADGVMYAPGAEAVVDGLGFDPGRNYYLGYPANGKNLFPFDSVVPLDALPTQSQRLLIPGATPRGISNRLVLYPSAEVIDVEPVAQLYKVTPLSFQFNTDLGPAGLNEMRRNIDQPNSGQSTGGGASLRVMQDGFAGVGTSYDAVGAYQPSPHIDGSGRRVFIRCFEYSNTIHTYTFTDWPETDDGDMLIAWQHHAVSGFRPGVQFVATGDHTAPSVYLVQFTGTNMDFRKRVTVNGVVTETNIQSAPKVVASDQIQITRVSKQGSAIRLKNWVAPAGWEAGGVAMQEPAAWDIQRTDTSIPGSGLWGGMSHHDSYRIHAASLATLDGVASF